jgi:hypothetical protein
VNLPTLIESAVASYEAIERYFFRLSVALGGGGTVPMASDQDHMGGLDDSTLGAAAVVMATRTPSYTEMAVSQAAMDIASNVRDTRILQTSRAAYYADAKDAMLAEADQAKLQRDTTVQYLKGTTPIQGGFN